MLEGIATLLNGSIVVKDDTNYYIIKCKKYLKHSKAKDYIYIPRVFNAKYTPNKKKVFTIIREKKTKKNKTLKSKVK